VHGKHLSSLSRKNSLVNSRFPDFIFICLVNLFFFVVISDTLGLCFPMAWSFRTERQKYTGKYNKRSMVEPMIRSQLLVFEIDKFHSPQNPLLLDLNQSHLWLVT
jgi:hypothetical protein